MFSLHQLTTLSSTTHQHHRTIPNHYYLQTTSPSFSTLQTINMQSIMFLIAACTALVTASPTQPISRRGDPLLGDATCPSGDQFGLNAEQAAAGAEGFRLWVEQGADGQIDLSGNFKGQISV
jgi:hypothetical protein